MRLVAAELEARWNGALERVREREARLAAFKTRTIPQQHVTSGKLSEHLIHAGWFAL